MRRRLVAMMTLFGILAAAASMVLSWIVFVALLALPLPLAAWLLHRRDARRRDAEHPLATVTQIPVAVEQETYHLVA